MKSVAVLFVLAAAALCSCQKSVESTKPAASGIQVGAIRWDAWSKDAGEPGAIVHRTLAAKHWHDRLPFFTKIISDQEIDMQGNLQSVMDQEIDFAVQGGLAYWAFVSYDPDFPLNYALNLYLASEKKKGLNFCLILQGGWIGKGGMAKWPERMARYLEFFKNPNYQTVLGGRPLVYMFQGEPMVGENHFANWKQAKSAFDLLRQNTMAAGLQNPYLVSMEWSHSYSRTLVDSLGFDAISGYASSAGELAAPYMRLAAHTEQWWEDMKNTGAKVVPLVSAGWDPRPRIETPNPWTHFYVDPQKYYITPTPEQLAAHLEAGITWTLKNPHIAESKAIIIYSWNEHDEGGWIVPTLSEGAARLQAIARVLHSQAQ